MEKMRPPGEQEEKGMGMPVIYTLVAVSAFILLILAVVFVTNKESSGSGKRAGQLLKASPSPTPSSEPQFAEGQEDIETLYREHRLRSEDLDFWDMYRNGERDVIVEEPEREAEDASASGKPAPSYGKSPSAEPAASFEPSASPKGGTAPVPEETPDSEVLSDEEKAVDGKHTLVTYRDGTQEWVEILEELPPNTYDFTNLKSVNGQMAYYQNGEKVSRLGVDLSQSNGSVDFKSLKAGGVDFVMLRLGARGYESGILTLDENFLANREAAEAAGLDVGVIFSSQAVSTQEARSEADFVISNLSTYRIAYPVAVEFSMVVSEETRTDILDEKERTGIVETFLNAVEREGYYTILYGNKDQLLGELDEEEILSKYDVWLNDQSSMPDYPYRFRMWKYAKEQQIPGVSGTADYTISFVDYTRR